MPTRDGMTATRRRVVPRVETTTFAFLMAALMVEMIFFIVLGPLLPHYASTLHLSKLGAGVLSASYSIGCGIAALPAGTLVARTGPRGVTIGGLLIIGIACAGFALAGDVALLDAARIIQGIGAAALWAGAIAWLMALGEESERGRLIGLAFSAAGLGACVGPAVGALATVVGPRAVFLGLAAVIVALAGAGAMIAMRRPPVARVPASRGMRTALRSPATRHALWMVALPSLGFGVAGVLVPLRLHALGVGGAAIAGAYFAASVLETLVNPLVGRWYDRRGGRVVLRATLLCSLACAIVLAPPLPDLALLLALIVSWPVIGSVWVPALAELTGAVERAGAGSGLALGLFNLDWAIVQSIGAVAGGQFARTFEAGPFIVLAIMYAAGLMSLSRARDYEFGVQQQVSSAGARKT
jgi:predicted MFS family arabinose efflux permease